MTTQYAGRRGPRRKQGAGPHGDRRTRRARTRSAARRRALQEQEQGR